MPRRSRNLVICIDGTGNDERDPYPTNVLKLHRAIDQGEAAQQLSIYHRGVGNEIDNDPFWQKLGFNFGLGANRLRDEAYASLRQAYRPGDKIYIFGFSRGAAIARMLAVQINLFGINGHWVSIEMLGVWDTVAAFGIPMDVLGLPFQQINLFKDFTIARNVRRAYHLLAIDEQRTPFMPTLMNFRSFVNEVWFPGEHNNVGGGWPDSGLSDISLRFMIDRAAELGLRFKPEAVAALQPDPLAQLYTYRTNLPLAPRPIRILADNRDTRRWPQVHQSVLARMEALGEQYQPPNVLTLGRRLKVTL